MLLIYNKISDTKAIVTYRCESNKPNKDYFDGQKIDYIEVDSVLKPISQVGKEPQLCLNPQNNELFYVYIDRLLTDQERISNLETLILQQQGVI